MGKQDVLTRFVLQAVNIVHSYTPRTLRTCCSQSKFRILKNTRKQHACIIFVQLHSEHLAQCWRERERRVGLIYASVGLIHFLNGWLYFVGNILMTYKIIKMSYLSHNKRQNVCLRRVWIRLTTAYLLCAWEFRQNNALALQFWCLSSALTLRVRAPDASKSQRACIMLSKFTRKSKYAVINL